MEVNPIQQANNILSVIFKYMSLIVIIMIIMTIISYIKNHNQLKINKTIFTIITTLLYFIACIAFISGFGTMLYRPEDGTTFVAHLLDGCIPCIVVIVAQAIPLILALRKKKNKEDEVKKENV